MRVVTLARAHRAVPLCSPPQASLWLPPLVRTYLISDPRKLPVHRNLLDGCGPPAQHTLPMSRSRRTSRLAALLGASLWDAVHPRVSECTRHLLPPQAASTSMPVTTLSLAQPSQHGSKCTVLARGWSQRWGVLANPLVTRAPRQQGAPPLGGTEVCIVVGGHHYHAVHLGTLPVTSLSWTAGFSRCARSSRPLEETATRDILGCAQARAQTL